MQKWLRNYGASKIYIIFGCVILNVASCSRSLPACKLMLKILDDLLHPLRLIKYYLGILPLRETIWKKRNPRYLVQALIKMKELKKFSSQLNFSLVIKSVYNCQMESITWTKLPNAYYNANKEFTEISQNKFNKFEMIFTDGFQNK